jgi:hypothetical protein
MERDRDDKLPPLGDDDPGRSSERAEQDRLLEREAHRESWLARLWRHRIHAKGRPHPAKGAGDDAGPSKR